MPDTATPLTRLREPFPPGVVGKLPKPYKADSPKSTCKECGGYHGLPAVHLDFVGHAAVTDRLLSVDPLWTWEPFALDQVGLPALDRNGNMWIKLTVCGVTRIGVGDGKSMKELIGDAIRNAAMRFGVALDLWTKDELESSAELGSNEKPRPRAMKSQPDESPKSQPVRDSSLRTDAQSKALWTLASKVMPDKDEFRTWLSAGLGREVESTTTLTKTECAEAIEALTALTPADDQPMIPSGGAS